MGSLEENPLAVKLLDNQLNMSPDSHMKTVINFTSLGYLGLIQLYHMGKCKVVKFTDLKTHLLKEENN